MTKESIQKIINLFTANVAIRGIANGVWVSGGAALTLIDEHMGEAHDIDLFFENRKIYNIFLNFILLNGFKNTFNSEDAQTFQVQGILVQLVCKNFKPIDDILEDFDFKNIMVAVNLADTSRIIDKRDGAKELIKFHSYKNSSLKRLVKYMNQGYKVKTEDFNKFIDGHMNGELKPLYTDDVNTPDQIRRYLSGIMEKPHHIKYLFELYPDGDWLYEALFNEQRQCLMPFKVEYQKFLVNEKQKLAYAIANAAKYEPEDYQKAIKRVKELYPEYFISGQYTYYDITKRHDLSHWNPF